MHPPFSIESKVCAQEATIFSRCLAHRDQLYREGLDLVELARIYRLPLIPARGGGHVPDTEGLLDPPKVFLVLA